MHLGVAERKHLGEMARLHHAAFDEYQREGWGEAGLEGLLASPGVFALVAQANTTASLWGFIMLRVAADEAEIITIAVDPAMGRQGIGRQLVDEAMKAAEKAGAGCVFLEVAVDNEAALKLYEASGFVQAGRRRSYYRRGPAQIDAVVMRRDIAPV